MKAYAKYTTIDGKTLNSFTIQCSRNIYPVITGPWYMGFVVDRTCSTLLSVGVADCLQVLVRFEIENIL